MRGGRSIMEKEPQGERDFHRLFFFFFFLKIVEDKKKAIISSLIGVFSVYRRDKGMIYLEGREVYGNFKTTYILFMSADAGGVSKVNLPLLCIFFILFYSK